MTGSQHRAIVVGVDGSVVSDAALDWAVDKAARENRPLHIVSAYSLPMTGATPLAAPLEDDLKAGTQKIAEKAVARVHERAPEVRVTTTVRMAPPSVAILEAAADAGAVVVGSRGHRPLRGILLGSTALQVATHAPCPTIVVRDRGPRTVSTSPRRIVVGTDGSDTSRNALTYAFAQADARGCELVIANAWFLDLSGGHPIEIAAAAAEQLEEERRLAYVGITRAREKLVLSYAEARRIHGQEMYGIPSRFLREIPPALLHEVRPKVQVSRPMGGAAPRRNFGHAAIEAPALPLGANVRHATFGTGVVTDFEGSGAHARVQVNFDEAGSKWLVLAYANLQPG